MNLQYIDEQINMISKGYSIPGNHKLRLKILRKQKAELIAAKVKE